MTSYAPPKRLKIGETREISREPVPFLSPCPFVFRARKRRRADRKRAQAAEPSHRRAFLFRVPIVEIPERTQGAANSDIARTKSPERSGKKVWRAIVPRVATNRFHSLSVKLRVKEARAIFILSGSIIQSFSIERLLSLFRPGNSPVCMKIQRVHAEIRDTERKHLQDPCFIFDAVRIRETRTSRVAVNYLYRLDFFFLFFFEIVLLVGSSNFFEGDRGFYPTPGFFCHFNLVCERKKRG